MSKERMDDLWVALRADGWDVLAPRDLYSVASEVVTWQLLHSRRSVKVDLDFHLFGDLGQLTEALTHILYCQVRRHETRLYFGKRGPDDVR